MSVDIDQQDHGDTPSFAPWLAVTSCSLLPVVVALFAPPSFLYPLWLASGLLFVGGLLMLRARVRRGSAASTPASSPSAEPRSMGKGVSVALRPVES